MTLLVKYVRIPIDNSHGTTNEEAELPKKKVLIIDDYAACQRFWRRALARNKIELLSATTRAEGFALFRAHKEELEAIVFDGRLERYTSESQSQNDLQSTLDLIRRIKILFSGHMVAAASRKADRAMMMQGGCNLEFNASDSKLALAQYIIELLQKEDSSGR